MRDYTGVPFSKVEDPPTRRSLAAIDYFLRDASRGFSRIQNGEVPDGSGLSIISGNPTLADYLFLPGRTGGQTIHGVDSDPLISPVTIDPGQFGTSTIGLTGSTFLGFDYLTTPLADFRTYFFDNSTKDLAIVPTDAGPGPGVYLESTDLTSGMRFLATQSRAFIQSGKKNASNQTVNSNQTFGGSGATCGSSLATEYLRINLDNSSTVGESGAVVGAHTTRVGINVKPDAYASSTTATKAGSLHIVPTSATITDPAMLVLESGTAGQPVLEIRGASSGSSPSKLLGTLAWQVNQLGDIKWFNNGSGTRLARVRSLGDAGVETGSKGGLQFLNTADRLVFETLPEVGAFADSVSSLYMRIANTANEVNRLMLCSQGSAAFSRLGILATSVILGPAGTGTLPAPLSSRILTLVNSSGTVLSGMSSAGAYFLTAGGSTGYVYVSDSVGQGSWSNAIGVPGGSGTVKDTVIGAGLQGAIGGLYLDDNSTFFGRICVAAAGLTADREWTFPDASGNVVLTGVTNSLHLAVGSILDANTQSSGTSFTDTGTTTKKLRFILSTAVGNNAIQLNNTAARLYQTRDLSGDFVVVGNDPPAVASGALGKVDDAGKTLAIGSTNLSSTPPAGVYRVCGVLTVTTAGGADRTIDVTIAWTDSRGAQTRTLTGGALSGAATNSVDFDYTLYVASGDIAYSTTVAGAAGSAPTYELRIRVVALG